MALPLFESPHEIAEFERCLATRSIGKRIQFIEKTQSTNDLALHAARNGGAHGSVFIADAQTAGRGRRGRNWDCPPGMGLLFSVLIRPEKIPPEAAGWIPLAAGLSCAEALAALSNSLSHVTVKWPNDIVLPSDNAPGWKKLGGILCESALPALSSDSDANRAYAVIGIGININQTRDMLPETDKAPPSSVYLETKARADRKTVLQIVIERLEINLDKLNDTATRADLRATIETKMRAWMQESKTIHFRSPPAENAPVNRGIFTGLDEFGRIRIQNGAGENAFADAEIIKID